MNAGISQRPVTLQINSAGAWRNVCRFNAANDATGRLILKAAATIATHADGGVSLRIVEIQDGYPSPLASWSIKAGWVNQEGRALS